MFRILKTQYSIEGSILFPPEIYAMNKRIKGFEQNLLGRYMFSTMWLEE